jgi:predicted alpha/beta hydrolase
MSAQGSPFHIAVADGYRLSATRYGDHRKASHIVLIASAVGVRQHYYRRFSQFLAAHGLEVITFDFRGIGGSRPSTLRGFETDLLQWAELDLAGMIDCCRDSNPDALLVGVGHSMGGQLFGLARNNGALQRLITVCSQSGYLGHWSGVGRLAMRSLYSLMPLTASLLSYFPASKLVARMEDLPAGVARQWAEWGRNPRYLHVCERDTLARFARIRAPLLSFSFEDDGFAPRAAVDWMAEQFAGAERVRRHVSPAEIGTRSIGHFRFFRPEFEPTLWHEALRWLSTDRRRLDDNGAARSERTETPFGETHVQVARCSHTQPD